MHLLLCILLCLAFYVVIFVKSILKDCTGSILNVLIISIQLLTPNYSLLTQLWIYSHQINLSGDIELNPGLKQDILITKILSAPFIGKHFNQCFFVCHWNLNSITYNFSKIQCLMAYNCIHKFNIYLPL